MLAQQDLGPPADHPGRGTSVRNVRKHVDTVIGQDEAAGVDEPARSSIEMRRALSCRKNRRH